MQRFQVRHFFITRMVDGVLENDGDVYQVEVTAPDDKRETVKVAMCLEDEDARIVADALNVAIEQRPEVQIWAERLYARWRDHLEALEQSLDPRPVTPPAPEPIAMAVHRRRPTQD
jgi:hypothetical protein